MPGASCPALVALLIAGILLVVSVPSAAAKTDVLRLALHIAERADKAARSRSVGSDRSPGHPMPVHSLPHAAAAATASARSQVTQKADAHRFAGALAAGVDEVLGEPETKQTAPSGTSGSA